MAIGWKYYRKNETDNFFLKAKKSWKKFFSPRLVFYASPLPFGQPIRLHFPVPISKMALPLRKKEVYNGVGCTGENISPALTWKNPPAGTKSFALTIYDIESITDLKKPGDSGLCPPVGDKPHRYIFTLYALNVANLGLPQNATPTQTDEAIRAHILASASFTAYYGR